VGAEALWPVVAGAVVIAIVAMVINQILKRGRAESDRDHARIQEEQSDEAAEIMAEPDVDLGTWSDRMRSELPED